MKRQFFYTVKGFEFHDGECFGQAWREAKAKAQELHVPVYRRVIDKNGDESWEVFLKGGCFLPVKYATADNVETW